MKCIIVAAGSSTRLRPLTDDLPKCLLSIGGKTILARAIENLLNANITKIAVVVGFEAEKIRSFLERQFPFVKFRFILNPNFASTNNAYSLLLARDFFLEPNSPTKTNQPLLVLDSDIVFHPGLLQKIAGRGEENRIAVRVKGAHDAEEVRVALDSIDNISEIGKDVIPDRSYGESIGIEWFRYESAKMLFEVLDRRVKRGSGRTEFYEMAFQELIGLGVKIKAVDASDFPAIEIDSPADLELAERVIVPSIDAISNVRLQ
jgi:choline kinase